MRAIYKYGVPIEDTFNLSLPRNAQVLTVAVQREVPCIWVLVEPGEPGEVHTFHLRGTGHDASGMEHCRYIGSFQILGGDLVFHLFEE